MRNILSIALVLALAASAFGATVYITIVDEGDCWARIDYNSPDADVSAFGLDITVTGANIVDINEAYIFRYGACDGTNKGYGIFPGSFRDHIVDPCNPNWNDANYTPIADSADKGALGGLGTAGVTIEMGALYEDGNEPPRAGTLCGFKVSQNCTMSVTGNATRANVVLVDANQAVLDVSAANDAPVTCEVECYVWTGQTQAEYDYWVDSGSPECWCYPRQCHGDADGLKYGSPLSGYWYVGTDDIDIMSAGWLVKDPTKGTGIVGQTYNGVPLVCADFMHDKEGSPLAGYWRVGTSDIDEMSKYWLVKEPTKGTGTPADCNPGNRTP